MAVIAVLRPQPDPFHQHSLDGKIESFATGYRSKQSQSFSKMSSTLSVPQEVQRGVKRTRKSHTKVRTGCLTCKIRKKKCDETKPACTRCTSTGRKCDGYPTIAPQPAKDSHESQKSLLPVVRSPTPDQVLHKHNSREPRVIELPDDDGCVDNLLETDENVDEAEVTDFILSYASNTSPGEVTSATSPVSSTSTALCLSTQSISSLSTRHSSHMNHLPRSPNFFSPSSQISSIDASCFSYFKNVTGPSFASYFDSSMWRTYATSAALAHPVVFSAATALGAVHQRFNYGMSREAFEYCGHADRLHARAVRQLEELKNQHVNQGLLGTNLPGGSGMGIYDRDVIMVSEMLLGLFEGFQQNYPESVAHINNGMKYLLARPMTLMHSQTSYCAVGSQKNVFRQLFNQLERRAVQLFGSDTKIMANREDAVPLPVIPDIFPSLDVAKDFLFTEVDWIMRVPEEAWNDQKNRSEAQSLHVVRLMKWSVSYAETIKDMERTPRQKLACKLMKLTRNATHLLLFMTLFASVDFELPQASSLNGSKDINNGGHPLHESRGSLSEATQILFEMIKHREYLTTHLARFQVCAESVLNDSSLFHYDEHSVAFDSAIGPPQRNDRMPESSNKTRHLVKTFLKNSPNSSALWEMLGVYGVAEKVSAVEEHAVIAAIRDIIPEHLDPRWVDITCLMESRKILLRYCRPDEQGLGMIWTQEWWAF